MARQWLKASKAASNLAGRLQVQSFIEEVIELPLLGCIELVRFGGGVFLYFFSVQRMDARKQKE